MGWIPLVLAIFQLVFKVWDAVSEHNSEIKKQKTEALQSGLRGVVDRDASRITQSFDDLNRLGRVRK